MIAGKLQYRLKPCEPIKGKDGFGANAATKWAEHDIIRAERVKLSSRERQSNGESFADYSAVWNIRLPHRVGEGWRVVEVNGNGEVCGLEWLVTNVEPNKPRGMKSLICRRVNR